MVLLLTIYVTLGLPALLGTLKLANEVLDLYERVRELRRGGL
jgi:hypothetical protein